MDFSASFEDPAQKFYGIVDYPAKRTHNSFQPKDLP